MSLDKTIIFINGKTFIPTNIWCGNKSAGDCEKKDGSHKLKVFDNTMDEIKGTLLEREKSRNRKPIANTYGDFVKQCVLKNQAKVI